MYLLYRQDCNRCDRLKFRQKYCCLLSIKVTRCFAVLINSMTETQVWWYDLYCTFKKDLRFFLPLQILSCLLCMKEENLNIKSIITLNTLYTEFINVSGILSGKIELWYPKVGRQANKLHFYSCPVSSWIGAFMPVRCTSLLFLAASRDSWCPSEIGKALRILDSMNQKDTADTITCSDDKARSRTFVTVISSEDSVSITSYNPRNNSGSRSSSPSFSQL